MEEYSFTWWVERGKEFFALLSFFAVMYFLMVAFT